MNRLWSVESTFSNTGAMADHRLAAALASSGCRSRWRSTRCVGGGQPPSAKFLKEAKVAKFVERPRRGAQGEPRPRGRRRRPASAARGPRDRRADQPERSAPPARRSTTSRIRMRIVRRTSQSITALAKDMAAGKVQSLVILGGNPVYDAPADLDFAAALAKVPTSVHLAEYVNETSQKTTWHVPKAHFLEAWGDTRTWDGTITIAQPLIAPLFGGLASSEMLSLLLGDELGSEALVRAAHEKLGVPAQLAPERPRRLRRRARSSPPPPSRSARSRSPTLTDEPEGRQQARAGRHRGGVPLLELHVRRSVREQRVAAGDPGLPHEGHLGQLRARRSRDRRGARISRTTR